MEVVVLGIDTDDRKISLGHKQVTDNPWDNFESVYGVGKEEASKVVRIIEKGIIVELSLGVDGFVPASQLSPSKVKNLSLCFPVDSKLPVKIVEFDKENKKIVLSALAALKDKTEAEIDEYIKEHKLEKVSVEDIRSADSGKFDASAFVGFDESAAKDAPKTEEKPVEKDDQKSEVKEQEEKEKAPVADNEEKDNDSEAEEKSGSTEEDPEVNEIEKAEDEENSKADESK